MKILVPLDGTPESESVLPWVRGLLSLPEARVRLLHVAPPHSDPAGCEGSLGRAARRLEGAGAVESIVETGAPGAVILRLAREDRADFIAMRTRCRQGIPRMHFGSVAAEVLQGARSPVLVTGPGIRAPKETPSFRSILVPLDGSDWSAQVLPPVAALALRLGARATLLHAGASPDGLRARAEELSRGGVACDTVGLPGHPATAILAHANLLGVDLVAMATHGRSGFQRLLLGSVAEEVVLQSPVPVLLRRPE